MRNENEDLRRLRGMAFGRLRHCGHLIKRFHAEGKRIQGTGKAGLLWRVYDWLLAPFTIWPIDFEGLANYLLEQIEKGQGIPRRLWLLLEVLPEPPEERTQRAIAEFEREVESGRYEKMVKRREKYEEREKALLEDKELAEVWQKVKGEFDVNRFRNRRGVIRRSVSGERNFRQGWDFDGKDDGRVFQAVFDVMCYGRQLYGMEKDKPLLLKVSFNPTPYGTLIMIPREISFDPFRDVDWKRIMELHRCWGTGRQGPKLSAARMERQEETRRARELWEEARRAGKKGEARYEYVRERIGRDPQADPGWLKRMLRGGREGFRGVKGRNRRI